MRPLADAAVVFACVFASGLLGLSLRRVLPAQHLTEDSMGMVRLCTGVVATLTALVLGLLVASAKGNYDRVSDDVTKGAVSVLLLDRTLAQYGEQTREARTMLRGAVAGMVNRVFGDHAGGVSGLESAEGLASGEKLETELRQLAPQNDVQRLLQARALQISNDLVQTRLLVINEAQGSLPTVFLVVLVLWLAIMFAGFGIVTARNPVVIVALALCALSLAGAVMMTEELNEPLTGFMKVAGTPLRYALAHLGG